MPTGSLVADAGIGSKGLACSTGPQIKSGARRPQQTGAVYDKTAADPEAQSISRNAGPGRDPVRARRPYGRDLDARGYDRRLSSCRLAFSKCA